MFWKHCAYPDRIIYKADSIKFDLYETDPVVHNSTRSELTNTLKMPFNETCRIEVETYIPIDWVPDDNSALNILQVHSTNDGPVDHNGTICNLRVAGHNLDFKINNSSGQQTLYECPIPYGQWVRWRISGVWGESGNIHLYRDDERVALYKGPTIFGDESGGHFSKFGIYCWKWGTVKHRTIYHRVGT